MTSVNFVTIIKWKDRWTVRRRMFGITVALSFFCAFLLSGCHTKEPISQSGFYLNTFVTVTLYDSSDTALLEGCMELCRMYEQIFSRTDENSELYRLNHGLLSDNDGTSKISDSLYELISLGIAYGGLSGGALDISIAPVSSLWDFSSGENQDVPESRIPQETQVAQGLSFVDYQKITLPGENQIILPEGMALDLGAIAKGYIADRIKEYLMEQGVNSAIINLGGNVLCIGQKPGGQGFQIGIQQPFADRNETAAVMTLSDTSVVTSGIYERYFTTENGVFYHHILDSNTGYPCDNELISVTIVSKSSAAADALSTACFCLGLEDGMALLDSLPDVYGVFITEDREMHYSEGFLEAIPVS